LNWALAGLRDLQKNGLGVPTKIAAATAAYRSELDILGDWISENCVTGLGLSEKKAVLYADYTRWAVRNGHHPLAQGKLTRRLNERKFPLAADKRTVRGLALIANGLGGTP
jgi:putative DNA primase/helicase